MSNSLSENKAHLAQCGFEIVPSMAIHAELGMGIIYQNADGIRFVPFDKSKAEINLTWEQFYAGPETEQ